MPAPAYKIKKILNKYLKQKLIIENKYNIHNSKHLTQLLQKVKINNKSKMISLDIKDMYTNIPVKDTLKIIQQHLQTLNHNDHETKQLIALLEASMEQNYFTYDNQFYLQPDGLPMGSPLSSVLSEIYLQEFEKQLN